jgi:hypothetical protein
MLEQATKDFAGPATAVSIAMMAWELDDEPLALAIATTNRLATANRFATLAVLEDDDDSDGGVQLPNEHLDSDSDDDDEDELTPLQEVFRTAYAQPTVKADVASCKDSGSATVPAFLKTLRVAPADCSFVADGTMLMVNGRLYIPEYLNLRTRYVQQHHDPPLAGHQGINRTFELLTRTVFWPKMWEEVARYVRNCHPCRRANASRLKLQGTLAPHAIPSHQWENIAVDFIVDLPASKGTLKPQGTYKNIMTVTDHLTKMVHFLPIEDMSAKQTAHLFH